MDSESRKRVPTSVPLLLTLILVFSTTGCLLLDKIIIDVYDAVFGVPQDVAQEITHITNTLIGPYCIGANRTLELSANIKQTGPGPSGLDVEAEIRDAKAVALGSQKFSLIGKLGKTGSNFKTQKFAFNVFPPDNCIPAGGAIYVEVTPRGGSIQQNAQMKTKLRVH